MDNEQIKKGYKLTEVGLIPDDWEVKKIGDLLKITHGKSQHNVVDNNGKYPILGSGGQIGKANSFLYDKPSVLIGRKGTIDKPQYIDKPFWTIDTLFYSVIREKYNPKFIFYRFCLIDWKQYNEASGVPSLNSKTIENIEIQVPPIAEQEKIAEVLTDIDDLIEGLGAIVSKKRLIKQGVMQELFGQGRIDNEKWKIQRLGDIAEIIMGQSPSSKFYNKDQKGLSLIQGNADILKRKAIKRIFTSEITKQAKSGDIIMSVRAPVGEIAITSFDACIGRGVCAIRYDNNFLYHYLVYKESTWSKISKGSTFDSVSSLDVKNFEIALPSTKEEQEAIAQILTDMDKEIEKLEEKLEKYKQIKQGMMQELLTGKIRLK